MSRKQHPPVDELTVERIRSGLEDRFWKEILCYRSVGSTNTVGLSLPLGDDNEDVGRIVVADSQEKGRGRFDRTWISPPGVNIHASIVLRPGIPPAAGPFLTILAALAAASAMKKETGIAVSIKWPNDLIVSRKKLGGILTEARTSRGVITRAVIGIGINLNLRQEDFPPEISAKATSSLICTGSTFPRAGILSAIMNEFEPRYEIFRKSGGLPLVREMKPLLDTIGREITICEGGEQICGVAEDIDDNGRLIVSLPSGLTRSVGSGEIVETDTGSEC
ncbi:MAG: biotin--[acetyl-CoA-carboxylase] ligase [Nitrospiraceae bacterium]|nr:biotin--[acetyl-CoA-carboxylase] ligase [Nitrospiraceae bacterium]